MSEFEEDLEFLQSLLNPNYLRFLSAKKYFQDKSFIKYLNHLKYLKNKPYCYYLTYPESISLLETILSMPEITNTFIELLEEQLERMWRLN